MSNPNSPYNKLKRHFKERWRGEDYPGGTHRFQLGKLAKDVGTYIVLPALMVIFVKSCESKPQTKRLQSTQLSRDPNRLAVNNSQIITFSGGGTGSLNPSIVKRAPGTLVRIKLLNVVETYSTAPVHARIVDNGLGANLRGGTLIGDAVPDSNFERINITFRYARDPRREGFAASISARGLSLDGTLGIEAKKKEGFVTRSTLGSASSTSQEMQGKADSSDFKQVLFRALTVGLVQEFGSESQVEKNRANVLTLQPATVFFAELTDYFPGASK